MNWNISFLIIYLFFQIQNSNLLVFFLKQEYIQIYEGRGTHYGDSDFYYFKKVCKLSRKCRDTVT